MAHRFPFPIFLGLLLTSWLFSACTPQKAWHHRQYHSWEAATPPPDAALRSSTFLIGDAGSARKDTVEPSFALVLEQARRLEALGVQQQLIFLGDNIYTHGLSPISAPDRPEMERRLIAQLDLIKAFPGRGFIIPGNHDWNHQHEGGLAAIRRQQVFADVYLRDFKAFQPKDGCPGPVERIISDEQVIILIDSEWFLHRYEKPMGEADGCGVENDVDFFVQIEALLRKHAGKHILIATHHPLFTNGSHGGYYTWKDHLFPLTNKFPNFYLPLPVIGSLYPLVRKYGISPEDLPHPRYQKLKNGLLGAIGEQPNVVLASGHEHSLQLHKAENAFQIVSGAGTRESPVQRGHGAAFVYPRRGYARVNYYRNGEAWVEFWEAEIAGKQGELLFRTPLYARQDTVASPVTASLAPETDSMALVASHVFEKGTLHRAFFGNHNRDLWTTPVKVATLDMETFAGGLTPIKKGGGFQTMSLRLQGADGVQYNLRSIDKDPEKILPEGLRQTFAQDLLKDQISVANPYGAFAVPKLAAAAGVLHTDPQLVQIPFSPRLGPYLNDFGGMLALLEIRPDEDLSAYERFGNSKNVVGSRKLFEELRADNDNQVDARQYLRSRYLDMLIGDLDRHEDQWRWAEFEKADKGEIFLPIPRDRDQVFLKVDGLIPRLLMNKWAIREIENYGYEIRDLRGLNIKGFPLDQRLLAGLELEDWEAVAREVQQGLSDQAIEAGIAGLPPAIYAKSAGRIIPRLKQRRDDLLTYARTYYRMQAQEVDIVGSDKHEHYEIDLQAGGGVEVTGFKAKKTGEKVKEIYHRTFDPADTREINLYALGGNDRFVVRGRGQGGPIIRMIGGEDEDRLDDQSEGRARLFYYDRKDQPNELVSQANTKLRLRQDAMVNAYERREGAPDYWGPTGRIAFNPDDGAYVGVGVQHIKRRGFRKHPYTYRQSFQAAYAFATGGNLFLYQGDFIGVLGAKNNLEVNAAYEGENYVRNFFGFGNETVFAGSEGAIDSFRVRQLRLEVSALAYRQLSDAIRVEAGPFVGFTRINPTEGRIVTAPEFPFGAQVDSPYYEVGLKAGLHIRKVDDEHYPTRGVDFRTHWQFHQEIGGFEDAFTQLRSSLSLYLTPTWRFRPTLALRGGVIVNTGDFKFYQAATVGNLDNLRGFRRNRFAGQAAAYQNAELRVPLFRLSAYLFKGQVGVMGFADNARVWQESEESAVWHQAYGPGIWVNFFDQFLFCASYGFSREENLLTVKGGFLF